jgi:ATP-dependent DNA helicase RecQ
MLGAAQAALDVQTAAFTATADAATRADILAKLFRRNPRIFVHGFDRPNLRLRIRAKASMAAKSSVASRSSTTSGRAQVMDFVRDHVGESGIVYCRSRRRSEAIAELLRQDGVNARPYHAGLDPASRSRHQDMFLHEDGVVMVATIAFGLGIDKPDVRFVLHADLPANIESYYHEIGRAGRDGLPADTLTLYDRDDIWLRRMQIEQGQAANEQKRIDHRRLDALVSLCESAYCRRLFLLDYFGEAAQPCGNCDICLDAPQWWSRRWWGALLCRSR